MTGTLDRPAFYAIGAGQGRLRDWLTLLHPPYTAWHLSYVAIGAALAPVFVAWRLEGTLLAFFLAVGIGAHALDELTGRPLGTGIRTGYLRAAAVVGVAVPVVVGLAWGGVRLLPFVVVGSVVVAAYNLEMFGGALHTPAVFAFAWGAFPVLTGYYVQDFRFGWAVLPAAAAAFALSWAQCAMSRPVRTLRRRTALVTGRVVLTDGSEHPVDRATLLAPLERALRATAAGVVCLALAMVVGRL